MTDDAAIPSLTTALNNAMYLIGELTNDEISTRSLTEMNLRFARIEEIIGAVQFNRQEEGWGIPNPRSLQLLDEHIASRVPLAAGAPQASGSREGGAPCPPPED